LDGFLDNPPFILALSYTVGLFTDLLMRRIIDYSKISSFSVFKTQQAYERLGILPFMRAIKPFTVNHGLKNGIKSWDIDSLREIRDHMTAAEIGHWAGAIFMLGVTLIAAWFGISAWIIVAYLVLNLYGNVYLSLLQQYNKKKLDAILELAEQAKAASERR